MAKNSKPLARDGGITTTWRKIIVCVLIILVGFNLRSVILAVPPILPLIQHDLRLNYTAAGFLTSLPLLVLSCAAWPSGLLCVRIGESTFVLIGLGPIGGGEPLHPLLPTAS